MNEEVPNTSLYLDIRDLEGAPVNHVLYLKRLINHDLIKKKNYLVFQKQNEILLKTQQNVNKMKTSIKLTDQANKQRTIRKISKRK
jgi:hypothetical protein